MSITLMNFLIPKFMELGWSVANGIWCINKSLAFAFWERRNESAMENECCSHCPGEWELVLYFDENIETKMDLTKMSNHVWRSVAPSLFLAEPSIKIVQSGHGNDRKAHYNWIKWVQDEHPIETACYPNYSHWPVVFARVG